LSSPQPTQPLPPLSRFIAPIQAGNPWTAWLWPRIAGQFCPGTLLAGEAGLRGFERKTGWDVKAGKGTKGATLTLKDQPPVKGTITMRLIGSADFAAYDAFAASVLSTDDASQQATGLSYFYPGHAGIGLSTIVIEGWKLQPQKGGIYHLVIDVLEWSPPPDTSVVSTVEGTAPNLADNVTEVGPGVFRFAPKNAEFAAEEAQIAALTPQAFPSSPQSP
jgi:hypothetical protein